MVLNNPTKEEVLKYFERRQEDLAGSNTGSEELANSPIDLVEEDK